MVASQALVYAYAMEATSIPEDVLDPDEQDVAWEELVGQRLVVNDRTLAGRGGFDLTAWGRSTARRLTSQVRREYAQRALLRALADGERSTNTIQVDSVYGEPFSDGELQQAVRALTEWKFIEGVGSWQSGGHLLRANITSLGLRALDSEWGPEEYAHHEGNHMSIDARQYNQHGHGNVQQNGDGNVATINSIHGADLGEVADLIEWIRSTERIDHTADAALDSQLELADDAIEAGDTKKLRTVLQTLPFIVTTTFGEEAGRAIADQAGSVLASLPF